MRKISERLSKHFHFVVLKFSVYLNRLVFVMEMCSVYNITGNRDVARSKTDNLQVIGKICFYMDRNVRKRTCVDVHPAKIEISLRNCAV